MAIKHPAPCGLDCSGCNLYNAEEDLSAAAALVDWFRARGWIGPQDGAEAVQSKAPFCMGCRAKQGPCWCGDCALRACCAGRGHADCGDCPDFPCGQYREWTVDTPHHQAAMELLLTRRTKEAE